MTTGLEAGCQGGSLNLKTLSLILRMRDKTIRKICFIFLIKKCDIVSRCFVETVAMSVFKVSPLYLLGG